MRRVFVLFAILAAAAMPLSSGEARTFLGPKTQYTQSQIQSFFQNSSNPYLSQNAASFANISYNVESNGYSGAYNGSCCTGLMQMNNTNLKTFCQCSRSEYANMSGQEQINIYGKYFNSVQNSSSVQKLMQMQAAGQTLNGQQIDGAMIAACAQLGTGNCAKSIANGCAGVSTSQGGDGHHNICTMSAKAGGGSETSPGGGGNGTCLAAQPVQDPVIYSDYGAWNRPGVSGGKNGWHRGVDIWPKAAQSGASKGKPIYAAHSGKVGTFGGASTKVQGTDFMTLYEHSWSRPDERQVNAGEEIAKIGDRNAAAHLHFEVMVKGSAISNASCSISGSKDDCVFPANSGKRDPNAMASMEKIKAASPNSWFRVNPERYLKSRVPLQGNATSRTGRTESLPNTCTPGDGTGGGSSTPTGQSQVSERPVSASETGTPANTASTEGSYLSGNMGSASVVADMDQRSVMIDMARQAGMDVRTRGSLADNLSSQFDSSIAHMLVLEARR